MINYIGNNIVIEEMPQGCIVTPINRTGLEDTEYNISGDYIIIASKDDAIELIESLKRLLKIQFGVAINE